MNGSLPNVLALSIKQPWAWLIVNGYKDIENRSWSTSFRGEFLVHASKAFDETGYLWVSQRFSISLPHEDEFLRGGIVGIAEIVDCVTAHESKWFEGPYGFVLGNPRPVPFVAVRGQQSFFRVVTSR